MKKYLLFHIFFASLFTKVESKISPARLRYEYLENLQVVV